MDNYYNSPALVQFLQLCNTNCLGAVSVNGKAVPKKLQESKLQKHEVIAQHNGSDCVLPWQDKEHVTMISAYHGTELQTVVKRRKERQKPESVIHYNPPVGGIDKEGKRMNE